MPLLLALVLAVAPGPKEPSPLTTGGSSTGPTVQQTSVYRVVNARAAPGRLLEVIELLRERAELLEGQGEEPGWLMRHSQGDHWDLMYLEPAGTLSAYFDDGRRQRLAGATSPAGRTGAELARAIEDAVAWREETFAAGPPIDVVRDRFQDAGLFHVEMFIALPGKRSELVRERQMENHYLAELGRAENLIFERVAGAAWDSFTIGFYDDLRHYAEAGDRPAEEQQRAAVAAGFEGADRIGTYLRELIASHHDTLAVPAW